MRRERKAILTLLFLLFLFMSLTQNSFALSCSCSSYPCSTSQCSGSSCESGDYVEYTGTCEATGFGGGICEEDVEVCDGSTPFCDSSLGCVECINDDYCPSDEYYCANPSDLYYEDNFCFTLDYTCRSTNTFIEDCNDRDGNYCNGNLRELRNYFCSGDSCDYGVTSTTDCSVYTTSFSEWFCDDASTSRRERDLGVCDLGSLTWCDTIEDSEENSCSFGCATNFLEKEYKYQCANLEDYALYEREIEGLCRKESTEPWTITGTGEICSSDSWCENDEIISSTTPSNPCINFNPITEINQSVMTQNKTIEIETYSAQTFKPDVVLYDINNDGVYDIGHGLGCDAGIESTYCDGESCCSGENFDNVTFITGSEIGNFNIKYLSLETNERFEKTGFISYSVLSAFVVADIDSNDFVLEKGTPLSLDDNSYGDPEVTAQCWRDGIYKFECYGDSDDCAEFCPGYDYVNPFFYTDFSVKNNIVGTRSIQLIATNGEVSSRQSIEMCVYDYENGDYCGTCNDGIQNDDETGVDAGGHCGTCSDGIQNGLETYIDYGGPCGTCYDGKRQAFETIDIDYGGICGNCTGDKETDTYWSLGRSLDDSIPFDNAYCGEATDNIIGVIQVVVVLILGALFIFILVSLGVLSVISVFFFGALGTAGSFLISFVKERVFTKKDKKDLNNKNT